MANASPQRGTGLSLDCGDTGLSQEMVHDGSQTAE